MACRVTTWRTTEESHFMNFLLSDEQREMQNSVERYFLEQCDSQRLHRAFDDAGDHDADLWRGLCDLGVLGIAIPEAFGGMGLELIDLALVAEALGRAAAPVPFLGHVLATMAIAQSGNASQRERWLPALATGELLATVAFAESSQDWQPEQWTIGVDEATQISGAKSFVPAAAVADLIVVGLSGGRFAVVERNAQGVQVGEQDGIDRTRRLGRVTFDRSPVELLPESAGSRIRDAALVLLAADAFGGASRCVEMAVDYAKTRKQFGTAIGRFQGLKHQIVNMATEVEPARALYWYAAHAWDHLPQQAAQSAAVAKAHLADRYLQAARDTVEAHGGIGYTWEFDLQILFKRAMFDYSWMGSPTLHRERIATLAGW
jgi:alkylation response protein AidB-like acyl-CoA dehydrogenase